MGTNFYFKSNDNDFEQHIGKRSAAGYFCWDCHVSLNYSGNHRVHYSEDREPGECLVCGQPQIKEDFNSSTAGRELGFNKTIPDKKVGVKTCCSFSWAITLSHFNALKSAPNIYIENEYGDRFTIADFANVLRECPLQFFDSIGHDFC